MGRIALVAAVLTLTVSAAVEAAKKEHAATFNADPSVFFGPDAYPPAAMRAGEQGRVVARLTVAADARVTDCAVLSSSGSVALDGTTCRIALRNIIFVPATDRRGRAIASSYTLPVRWVLPDDRLRRRSTNEILRVEISADNKMTRCSFSVDGQDQGPDHPACRYYPKQSPAWLELTGEAAPRQIAVTIQHIVQFSGDPLIALVHAAPSHKLIALKRAAVEISPAGEKTYAQVVDQRGHFEQLDDPATGVGRFMPAGKADKLDVLTAISVEPAR